MWRWALLIVVALTATACGDSGEGGGDAAVPSTSSSEAPGSACPGTPFAGTIERTVEATTSNGVHAAVSRTDGEIASAYAYSFGTGDTYTVYVGDHEIDRDGVGVDTLKAPSGGMLATIFLRASEQLVAGSVVDLDFVPIVDTGGGAEVGGFGPDDLTGSATVIGVDDDRICFEIDTSDPQQEVHGTVSAEIVN